MTLLAHVSRLRSSHPSRVPAAGTLAALLGAMSLTACASLSGLSTSNHDAGKSDAATTKHDAATTEHDATSEAAPAPACTGDDAGYHDFTNEACWSTYELPSSVDPSPGYFGGTFDGRYVYVASRVDALVVRYDTQSSFTTAASWSSHDTSLIDGAGQESTPGYQGVVFDGRYVYLVPNNGLGGFVRYDSTAPFDSSSSWTVYVLDPPNSVAYSGGTFDGRYVYFAPTTGIDNYASGKLVRYDTTQSFANASSWSSFDTLSLGSAAEPDAGDGGLGDGGLGDGGEDASGQIFTTRATGFFGAIFDGRYVYLVPFQVSFVIPRYDTTAPFGAASSWELIDLANTPNFDDNSLSAGAFDGTNLYIVPGTASNTAISFDVTKQFTSTSSWIDYSPPLTTESPFGMGAFDGRYIYYVPLADFEPGVTVAFVRYDSAPGAGGFTDAVNWSSHNATHLNASGFGAAVFDGRYLYVAPFAGGAFARFDAKDVSAQPNLPHYFGSFF